MPYSPFTRFLGCVLVALVLLGLLWPDDRALEWAWHGTGAMAVLLAIFTWSAVKNAPPLDDRAFQHCLPPGANRAFFRMVWIHVLVLAGVSFAVILYCALWNFGWRAMSWGVVMLAIPAWALMSAVGVASSAGTSQQHWKSAGWFAIFAPPVFSWVVLYWMYENAEKYVPEAVYFTPLRTVVLTAAVLYPLVWWLIAARKRRGLGLILGGATSALLPWLMVYGDFVKDERQYVPQEVRARFAGTGSVTVSRKPFAGSDRDYIGVEDLIDVQGLAEGEFTCVKMFARRGEKEENVSEIYTIEVSHDDLFSPPRTSLPELLRGGSGDLMSLNHMDLTGTFVYPIETVGIGPSAVPTIVGKLGGKIVWGSEAVGLSMRRLLPSVETFVYRKAGYHSYPSLPGRRLVVENRDESGRRFDERPAERPYDESNPKSDLAKPWFARMSRPTSWKLLGSCLARDGGTFRIDGKGTLQIVPLAQQPDGQEAIEVRRYFESLWQAQGPWFGDEKPTNNWSEYELALVAIDEAGKSARVFSDFYLLDEFGREKKQDWEKVMLGEYDRTLIFNDDGLNGLNKEDIEILRKSHLYVLECRVSHFSRDVELPVPAMNR
ncbi:MAG: hypothetical protein EOP84_17550 [Verrucomicrobiaceae bacterium]|nr:MAG: hypothetical protein EOP84_17550 [Verrucomicrobiaceae bacterium]